MIMHTVRICCVLLPFGGQFQPSPSWLFHGDWDDIIDPKQEMYPWRMSVSTLYVCTGIAYVTRARKGIRKLGADFARYAVSTCNLWYAVTVIRCDLCRWSGHLMTSSNGNIFRVTGPLCGEFAGHRWIPRTKASDAELWCFLWSVPE